MREFIELSPDLIKIIKDEALMEAMREYNRWPISVEVAPIAELVGEVLLPKVSVAFEHDLDELLLTIRVVV